MSWLLDVSALVALLTKSHVHHKELNAWAKSKRLYLCPLTELGFIRVSTSPAHNATMEDARQALADFIRRGQPGFIAADNRALDGDPAPTSGKTTDWYLAHLAESHKMKLATLDKGLSHRAAEIIS